MLCFVQTDAALAAETADLLLGVCVKRSFDRISVDGQLSTNDTAILMCSGASGVAVEPESEDELRFGQALDALLRQLALDIVRDGEGARRIGRVVVRGGHGDERRARRARGGQLAAGQGRAARRRPQLGAHRAGRRDGAARHRAAGRRRRDRGRAGLRARRRDRLRRARRSAQRRGARRGRVRRRAARRRPRDRGLLLRPQPRVRDRSTRSTRRDAQTSAPCSRRSRTSGSSTARRSSSSTAARRWRTRRCARSSRATSCCSSTSG